MIGSTGHVGYVLQDVPYSNVDIVGVSPGSDGEGIDGLYSKVKEFSPRCQVFTDYHSMLDELRPDLVVVACQFGDLAQVIIEALSRNIHVFAEKPMALTLEELIGVRQAYSEAKVHLAAMFGIRYHPSFLTAWEQVRNGKIGYVRLISAQKSYKLGDRPAFFRKRETCGGTIPWVGIHAVDWVHWFSGERFVSVFASHSRLCNQGHGDLEVAASCHFTLTNEVAASITIDYFRPESALSHDDDRLRVVGTDGIIEVKDGHVYLLNADNDGQESLPFVAERGIFADFVAQIRGLGQCLVSAEDSFYDARAALLARQSADENRLLYFD